MSDTSPPPKPKPGSLRDRIAAFEQKPTTSASGPPIAPRPKPGNLSHWKPRPPSPHDAQPATATNRNDSSMSANDAKESITKGGSLKERMAALQGLGAFSGGPPAAPPPRPAEKPKWKPPPQVAVAPPLTGDEDEGDSAAADKPPVSPLKVPSDDILAALSKAQPPPAQEPVQEGASEIEGEAPAGEEDAPDPEEEERQRRAAIAARMARLGGARVGMAPPIFGRKPEVKPKPATDVRVAEPQPRSEGDVEQAQAETGVAANAQLSTSPPTDETAAETPSAQPRVEPSENVPQHPPALESPNIPSRSMPIPQVPRRAAPPRKKSSQKQTPPTETEATTLSPEKDIPIPDISDTISESQTAPIPVAGHVEPEVDVAADPTANVYSARSADENLQLTEQTFGVASQLVPSYEAGSAPTVPCVPPPPLVSHTESPDELEVESRPAQSLRSPDNVGEQAVSSVPTVPQTTQEETEAETAVTPEPDTDEALFGPTEEGGEEEDEGEIARRKRIAERVAKMGGFNPFGGQPMRSPSLGDEPPVERKLSGGEVLVENEGTTPQNQPAAHATPPIPHSAFQQGGSATGVNEDGDDGDAYDESDPHAQVPMQHAVGDESLGELEGANDYNDAFTRVAHEVEVGTFTQAAGLGEHPGIHGGVRDANDAAAPSPPSTIHGQYATDDFGAAQTHAEGHGEPLAPALSTDDTSDIEMAPPRVTRPLPAAPVTLSPDVSTAPAAIVAPVPPPPPVPKRTSLPPPARTVPASAALDSPPLTQGSSSQRVPTPKRASLLPPSREIPIPAPDSPDVALQRRQTRTKRTSLPPPTRAVPSPSIPREGLVVIPPPPPSFGYAEQEPREPVQTKETLQGRPELIAPPPPVLPPSSSRKPSIPPPTPDGRRSMESRRSTDSRPSHEEKHGPGQYAMATTIGVPGPVSPPSRKRAPSSLLSEKEVLDDNVGDPIDPRFYTPSRSPIPVSPSPTSGTDSLSSASPATPSSAPPANESGGNEELKRRRTIAERMAKLGGIKFGAPPPPPAAPPVNRVQSPTPAQPAEDEDAEGSTAVPAQPAPEEEEEEDEQARRQRITAKLAGMGGMRFGMLPIQPGVGVGVGVIPPPPRIRPEEEATPRSPPRGIPSSSYPESEEEYEHPSSSDDGVQVEAEESELEEVRHEDLEDEYGVEAVEEERLGTPPPPPPPLPRSTRPPIPTGRPPPIPPTGRRPSLEATLASGRSGSFETITSTPRPPFRQGTSDFVMVEAEEVQIAHLSSAPQSLEPSDLAGTGQWEQPSISSGSLDFHDSGDLSASRWSEDSTTYPPAAPSLAPHPPPASGQPRAAPVAVSARVTADELRAVWDRVGTHVAEAASLLFERSKHTLVGTGSYEGFIAEALAQVPNAAPPRHPGEYGFLIYAQTGAMVHTRLTDIMPGDVVVLEGAKLKGHKGLQTYNQSVGGSSPCMGVVREFDAKKLKLRALQANQRVGQATVESVSYRLEDLKSGTIKVYRVQEA